MWIVLIIAIIKHPSFQRCIFIHLWQMIFRIHSIIVTCGWFFLFSILLYLLLNHVILGQASPFIRLEPLCFIQFLHLVILLLYVSGLLLPLKIHVLLDSLVLWVIDHPALLGGRLRPTLLQIVLVVLKDLKVWVHAGLGSLLSTSAGFLLDEARWVVADFLKHFYLLLSVHLPFKHIVARLLLLKTLEQILIFFSDPHHFSLSHVFI